jgi:hypothetical protein
MPIRKKTPDSEVDRYIEERMRRLQDAIVYNLRFVGEQVLNEARSTNSYKDRTGNLRSSLGYAIVVDGRVLMTGGFETVLQGGQGSSEGRAYVEKLARGFPSGIVLLVVAGMRYAQYVSARGYNVLDTSELLAEKLVPQMLKQIGF